METPEREVEVHRAELVARGGRERRVRDRVLERALRAAVQVEVYRAALLRHEGDTAEFEIECSTGTYVRTLIETLGDAYCERLRRTAVGPFPSRGREW